MSEIYAIKYDPYYGQCQEVPVEPKSEPTPTHSVADPHEIIAYANPISRIAIGYVTPSLKERIENWLFGSDRAVKCGEWITGGGDESCTSLSSAIGGLEVTESSFNADFRIVLGSPITFQSQIIKPECIDDPSKLSAALYVGVQEEHIADLTYSEGIFSTTLPAQFWGPPYKVIVKDEEGNTVAEPTIYEQLPFASPTPDDCNLYPSSTFDTDVIATDPATNAIHINEPVRASVLRSFVDLCDDNTGATVGRDRLEVKFIVSGGEYSTGTELDSEDDPASPDFYTNLIFSQTGVEYQISMYVIDTDYNNAQSITLKTAKFYANDPSTQTGACYAIGGPDFALPVPNTPIVKGDNTSFAWTINLPDCNGIPLLLTSNDAADYLYNPVTNVNGNTWTVTGQILPTIDGGAMQFIYQDNDANQKIVYKFLPTINPLAMSHVTANNFIQQGNQIDFFLMQSVPGATNYRYIVNTPTGPENPSNSGSSFFSYTPSQTGLHTLNTEVTTYSGAIISPPAYPFVVNAGASGSTCYDGIPPAVIDYSSNPLQITRGDASLLNFTISNLADGCGGDIYFSDSNASNVLYSVSQTPNQSGIQTTTYNLSGILSSNIGGGTGIQVTFYDDWGHTKIFNLPLPSIVPPTIEVFDANNWPTISEDIYLSLQPSDPFGASFRYCMPNCTSPTFDTGLLSSSQYTLAAANKNQAGTYSLEAQVIPDDGQTYSIPGSFVVHDDPTP